MGSACVRVGVWDGVWDGVQVKSGAWEVNAWEWIVEWIAAEGCGVGSGLRGSRCVGWSAASKGLGRGKWIRGSGCVGWRVQLKAGSHQAKGWGVGSGYVGVGVWDGECS